MNNKREDLLGNWVVDSRRQASDRRRKAEGGGQREREMGREGEWEIPTSPPTTLKLRRSKKATSGKARLRRTKREMGREGEWEIPTSPRLRRTKREMGRGG